MNVYVFGVPREGHGRSVQIAAPTEDVALQLFRVSVLFPEQYVARKFIKSSEYDSALERNVLVVRDGATIPMYRMDRDDKDRHQSKEVLVRHVPLLDCVAVDFSAPTTPLLEGPTTTTDDAAGDLIPAETQFASIRSKVELREIHDKMLRLKDQYEVKAREIEDQLSLLRNEVTRKERVLYAMTTYMGTHEEVIELLKGVPAAEELPISVYQQLLYMDEEVGIWGEGSIDFQNVDVFDKWISENYDKFLYREKAVCAFRVRRSDKEYTGQPLYDYLLNQQNMRTYFLIRNGTCLYRIYSDVVVPDTLFPESDLVEQEMKQYSNFSDSEMWRDQAEEKASRKVRAHLYCFAALQGLIDRTDIFGIRLRSHVNLLRPGGFTPDQVELIRDAESGHWVTDGRPSWHDFIEANRKTVGIGSRISITATRFYDLQERQGWRTYPFRPLNFPGTREIFIVEEIQKGAYDSNMLVIRYHPGDDVYDGWESHPRTHRVPFLLYRDEVLNIDEIEPADCDYYSRNRLERRHYLTMLPTLHWVKRIKAEERAQEQDFVNLVVHRTGADEAAVWEAVRWWKLKNKWKRAISKDDALALRMIERRVRVGSGPVVPVRSRSPWRDVVSREEVVLHRKLKKFRETLSCGHVLYQWSGEAPARRRRCAECWANSVLGDREVV